MDRRIKELIDLTKAKVGLDNYYLHTHKLYRKVNMFNDTVYTLCMEWFPEHITEREDEDYNPEGTAVIDIDVNSRQFESIIFVGGQSYAKGITFRNLDTNDIIEWIENETGLCYGKQFQLWKEEERALHFQECINGVAVSPSGTIEINFDEEGKLTLFSVNGHFPSKDKVIEEKFSLTLEDVEPLAREQLKLVEFPSFEQKRLIPAYTMEEIYVTNDKTSAIPFEIFADVRSHMKIDIVMDWQTRGNKQFDRKEISLDEDVTPEQAFACEPHPDTFPITKNEQEQCVIAVRDFLSQVFPDDTGKWVLKTLHREQGYIQAILKRDKTDNRVFQRKLLVFLDAKSIQAVNYMDNKPLIETFQDFEEYENRAVNKNEAYDKLRALIELKPVYVYDFEQKHYIVCGKIDCQYGVKASNGEVMSLDDL